MHQVIRVLSALCRKVSTPLALRVLDLAERGEWAELQKLRVEPGRYGDADSYFADAICVSLLRKCKLPGDSKRRYDAAVSTFWACELRNKKTNDHLERFISNEGLALRDMPVVAFIELWRKDIRKVLGPLPKDLVPRFSGGSTYADVGMLKTIPDKMTNRATYYPDAQSLLGFFWKSGWGRVSLTNAPQEVRGNVFFTVFKDATKDRGCCKEASINVGLQLDVAQAMRPGLKSCGWDLSTGKETHMSAARQASMDGKRATLDMSNASDTVAYNLVRLLLPADWFDLLDSLRAPMTRINGKWIRLEKFSSMGNGFTFELETLIFGTMARCVHDILGFNPDDVLCFGDDLIVDTGAAKLLLDTLAYFGFEPNSTKSFSSGDFRESCGGDYFKGKAVRPVFLEELPDEPHKWIALANALWRLPQEIAGAARMECLKNIPSAIASCQGPESLGDIVIHGPEAYWNVKTFRPRKKTNWQNDKYERELVRHYRCYRPIATVLPWRHWKPDIVFQSAMLGLDSTGITPRGAVTGWKLGWVPEPGSPWLPTSGD